MVLVTAIRRQGATEAPEVPPRLATWFLRQAVVVVSELPQNASPVTPTQGVVAPVKPVVVAVVLLEPLITAAASEATEQRTAVAAAVVVRVLPTQTAHLLGGKVAPTAAVVARAVCTTIPAFPAAVVEPTVALVVLTLAVPPQRAPWHLGSPILCCRILFLRLFQLLVQVKVAEVVLAAPVATPAVTVGEEAAVSAVRVETPPEIAMAAAVLVAEVFVAMAVTLWV